MLEIAVKFLCDELASYLASRAGASPPAVAATRLVDDGGKTLVAEDSIGVSVFNIEEDRVMRSQTPEYVLNEGKHVVVQPDLKVNLHLMFVANFRQYDQALKHLSSVLTFFQAHPKFSSDTHPALDPAVGRLTVELMSLTYEQLNQVWACIGGKMLPSAAYRVRFIMLRDAAPTAVRPPIVGVSTEIRGR